MGNFNQMFREYFGTVRDYDKPIFEGCEVIPGVLDQVIVDYEIKEESSEIRLNRASERFKSLSGNSGLLDKVKSDNNWTGNPMEIPMRIKK